MRRPPRDQVREELLAAAARVFARRGFHGASMEAISEDAGLSTGAISEDAGLSTGAIYSNFRGKEDLFLSLYEERIERRRGELRSAVERAGGGRAGLAAAGAEVEEAFRRDRDWFLLYFEFALHAARDPVFARRFRRVRQAGLRELEEGLSDGLEHARLEPSLPAAQLARGLSALSYGLALERLVEDGRGSEALFGRLAELIFRGLAESKT